MRAGGETKASFEPRPYQAGAYQEELTRQVQRCGGVKAQLVQRG